MKSIESTDVAWFVEEADEDLVDAQRLSGRSAPAARYSASQAAEKYLRALCEASDRPAGVMWDIAKIFETVRDIGETGTLSDQVALLGKFTTPARAGDGTTERMQDVLYAARRVRWVVRGVFGMTEPEPEAPAPNEAPCQSAEVIDSAVIPDDDDMIPTILPEDANSQSAMTAQQYPLDQAMPDRSLGRERKSDDLRPGRSDEERGTSFVKTFLVCDRCGVRIPRTRQTAQGRIPCSMCGRPMKLQR